MKKLFIIISITFVSCQKENWVQPIAIGTKFRYDGLKWLKKPNGDIPTNPFTVDSVDYGAYSGYNGYFVSSKNGLVYTMAPTDIRRGM